MRLHLFRGEAALEAALDDLVRARPPGAVALELGRGLTSIPRLLADAARPHGTAIDRAAELLLVHVASDALGPWHALAPTLRPVLARTIASLRRAGVVPSALRHVAPQLPDRARGDALQLAGRLERYEQLLGDRLDAAGLERRALQSIAHDPLPGLVEADVVELHVPAPFDPLTRLVLEALGVRGVPVRCGVPEVGPGSTRWAQALGSAQARALDVLESVSGDVERVLVPLVQGPSPSLGLATTPTLEARLVARTVHDRIARGLAPDEIVIAASTDVQRDRLRGALARYRVPVADALDRHVATTSVFRLVGTLLRLADERLPREGMAALLGSRLLQPLRVDGRIVPAGRIAATLREALPESARPESWGPCFDALAQPERRRPEVTAIAQHALAIRDRLLALPERAPLGRHLSALSALLDALGVRERVRRQTRGPAPDPRLASGAAQAVEQAAVDLLDGLLDKLARAARGLAASRGTASPSGREVGQRLGDRTYGRGEVGTLLLGAWGELALRAGGARGATVHVTSLGSIPDGATLLVLAGSTEDALRGATSDPLLHDETIATLGRALDRPLFDAPEDPARRERLGLARAMSRAAEILVTTSRADDAGRVLLPGELVELTSGVTLYEEALVPEARDARTIAELEARLLLEQHGAPRAREGLDEPTRAALQAALPSSPAAALGAMERGRDAFFAGEREAGAYDGRLGEVASALVQPGSAEAPLSASTLRAWAECPQRYFLERVLRLRTPDEATDELDERAGGDLAHRALEQLFTRWRDAALLPLRGRDEEATHIEAALAAAVASWRTDHGIGNELLFAQRERALGRLLHDVWRFEVKEARELQPAHFEWGFQELEVDGIALRGSIDRIDVLDGRAAVFDYKSGGLERPRRDLKEETFGDTSWQLPLYAAAVRERLGVDEVMLVFFSLREMKLATAAAPAWLRFDGELRDKLRAQVDRMRRGDFTVRPRADACSLCRLQSVCRVVERQDEGEVPA